MLIQLSRLICEFGECRTDQRANSLEVCARRGLTLIFFRVFVVATCFASMAADLLGAPNAPCDEEIPSRVTTLSSIQVSKWKQVKFVFWATHS